MQRCRYAGALAALLAAAAVSDASETSVTPVQKVTQLLNEMMAKGKEEKEAEKKAFTEFGAFCRITRKQKQRLIQDAKDSLVSLEADIAKASADAEQLGEEIAALDKDVDAKSREKEEATAIRKKERADFLSTNDEYFESIDAITRAIEKLKSRAHDVPQDQDDDAFVELHAVVSSRHVPAQARQMLTSFMQKKKALAETEGAPEANAYEFQSSGIIAMLEKLLEHFKFEKKKMEGEEVNTKHSYDMLMQSLTDNIAYSSRVSEEKAAKKAVKEGEAAQASGDKQETEDGLKTDEKYLEDLNTNCKKKSHEFEERQSLRASEYEVIKKALKIITSDTVAGAADKHLPAAMLQRGAMALAQLRNGNDALPKEQTLASVYLSKQAKKTGSALLATMASHATGDPFGKVRKIIKDLMVRLMEEANQEADHKGWCDTELSTNKQTRDNLGAEVETLTSEVDQLTAKDAELTDDISTLSTAIADLDESRKKAVAERADEKKTNLATMADAKAAAGAVAAALKMLRDFYAKAKDATALLQQTPMEDAPSTWDSSYNGMQGENTGIIGILEVIQTDFTRLEAETSTSEDTAVQTHQQFMDDTAEDKAVKETEMSHKDNKRQNTRRVLREKKKDLAGTQEDLQRALDYYEKLKPSCIYTGVSHEERASKREEEIQSLREALRILEGEDLSPA